MGGTRKGQALQTSSSADGRSIVLPSVHRPSLKFEVPDPGCHEPLLIVGASARAAAFSARRAGFRPYGVDLFGDWDLATAFPTRKAESYPDGFADAAREFPGLPWLFTGGLENHVEVVDRISKTHPLLGNSGDVLRRVRDPLQLGEALRRHGLRFPETQFEPPTEPGWLRKPLRSGGGIGVRRAKVCRSNFIFRGEDAPRNLGASPPRKMKFERQTAAGGSDYFQRHIPGRSHAAVFLAAGRRAVLLDVTEQLVGRDWTGATGFAYCGSLGPLRLPRRWRDEFVRIGDCLAREFGLVGLFGVDAIVNDAGVWTVEVNPRYTASIEVLERGLDLPTLALHVDACRRGTLPDHVPEPPRDCCGKAIVYARRSFHVSPAFTQALAAQCWCADIPSPDTTVTAGQPLATAFARGPTRAAVVRTLRRRCSWLTSSSPCISHRGG